MKKTILGLAIMAAGLMVASCGNKSEAPAAEGEQTEQAIEAAAAEEAAPAAEQPASLADIVAKAKAEGAKWSTDEWKEQYKKAIEAYKPFAVAMDQAQPADLEKITKDFADFPTLIKEFAATAKQSEGGKAIDEEWIAKTMEELGVPKV